MYKSNARTLPHPRLNNNANHLTDHRALDDQMLLNKGVYIPSPSPAPPPDGSYYNMNSDRYLSYPPLDYPTTLDFTTTPLQLTHLQPISQASIISGNTMIGNSIPSGGTLRRGILRGVVSVPPPDVTHHTTTNMGGVQIIHDLHPMNLSGTSSTQTTSTANGSMLSMQNSTPKQPQSILKDPNRNKQQQQQQHQQMQQQQMQQQQMLSASLIGVPGPAGSLQILNIPTSSGLSNNLLMTTSATFDPTNPHSLSTFNTSNPMAYTDADGHLV